MNRVLQGFRTKGFAHGIHIMACRIEDIFIDWKYQIDTRGLIPIETLVDNWTDCHDHFPSSYFVIRRALALVPGAPKEHVLLDYGCGKGRVVFVAALSPNIRRVIGLDISASLLEVARQN